MMPIRIRSVKRKAQPAGSRHALCLAMATGGWQVGARHIFRKGGPRAGLRVQRVETKAVDQFDAMTDDELRAYVYGDKDLDN
jgi:hypothetical protein